MSIDNDDDDLLTVSRNCRPILEHKLVSNVFNLSI